MDELVRWLGEQLDRDREIAVAAKRQVGDDWGIGDEPYGFILSDGDTVAYYEEAGSDTAMSRAAAVHAAQHPRRIMLREIDAKRQLLALHQEKQEQGYGSDLCTECGFGEVGQSYYPCATLRLLALPYANRPGYREDWRP